MIHAVGPGVGQPAVPAGEVIFEHGLDAVSAGRSHAEQRFLVDVVDHESGIVGKVQGVPVVFVEAFQGKADGLFGHQCFYADGKHVGALGLEVGRCGEPDVDGTAGHADACLLQVLVAAGVGYLGGKIVGKGERSGEPGFQAAIAVDDAASLQVAYVKQFVGPGVIIALFGWSETGKERES